MGAARNTTQAGVARANGIAKMGTISLSVTKQQRDAIAAAAKLHGLSPESYAVRAVLKATEREAGKPTAGAIAADRIRALSGQYGDPSMDAPELSRKLREESEAGR